MTLNHIESEQAEWHAYRLWYIKKMLSHSRRSRLLALARGHGLQVPDTMKRGDLLDLLAEYRLFLEEERCGPGPSYRPGW